MHKGTYAESVKAILEMLGVRFILYKGHAHSAGGGGGGGHNA